MGFQGINPSFSQNKQIADSLISALGKDNALNDSTLFNLYYNLSYYHPEPRIALSYADSALNFAEKMGTSLAKAKALEMVGVNNRILGNKVKSLAASFKALQLYETLEKKHEIAHTNLQIGELYFEHENYRDAIQTMKKSLESFESLADTNSTAFTAINLGEAYRLNNQIDSAILLYKRALDLSVYLNNEKVIIRAYATGNLGLALSKQGHYLESLENLEESVQLLEKLGDYSAICIFLAEKGNILIKQNRTTAGVSILKNAFEIASKRNLKKSIRDISYQLVQYFETTSNYEQAFLYQNVYQVYQDSLVNANNVRKIERIRSNYIIDKKELQIENLSIQNQLKETKLQQIILAVILIGLLLVILLIAYRNKQRANTLLNAKNQIITQQIKEKELLHKEIHHRVKNNLQMVSSIMGLQSQASDNSMVADAMSVGKSRVDAMSIIHQSLFSQENEPSVDIKHYLCKLTENLKATYRQELTEINTEIAACIIDADKAIPIGLIVNEAICNAVKYHKVKPLKIAVKLKNSNNRYTLIIADNGGGFNHEDANKGTGFGTKLIKTLAKQLNADVEFRHNGLGVSIVLQLNALTE